jgi:3-hydroxymyristoyl/3-hydroxydecanoyl-(acyl carrier protein) dehydratase
VNPLPDFPTPFDEAFLADLPYAPDVLFFDRILHIDPDKSRVVCRMPTDVDLPLTSSQRAHPVRHPRHVAGAVMVHASGMLGFVHAYYLLGVRHHEGWIGYGTHLHRVVFRKLVPPGDPIEATCTATRARLGKTRHFVRYSFEYRHQGALCYEGDQSAVWINVNAEGSAAWGVDAGPAE